MSILAPAVFVLPILSGFLLAHALWPERTLQALLLKSFLGIGIGLGLRGLLYFGYLLLFAGQDWFIWVELTTLVLLALVTLRRVQWLGPPMPRSGLRVRVAGPSRVLIPIAGVVLLISLLSTANYLLRRRQGDWDAWMMYNRAARFVYLDQAHWLDSFSPRMDPLFHADYPLLLAMNVASGWQEIGRDSAGVPMVQSALFAVACAGLLVAAVAVVRGRAQAALALILLWGIPVFVNEGARQMADVPLAFFVLATGSLLYLAGRRESRGLLALAGLTAGLAAWTKNEGAVLVVGASWHCSSPSDAAPR